MIDVHAHAMLPGVEALLAGDPRARQAREDEAAFFGPESAGPSSEMVERVAPLMLDLDARLAKMDAQGVDVQLISTSPAHYHAWAPRDLAARLARAIGEEIAALCECSERLHGLGYAPLQHPDVAETALVEAVRELGLRGFMSNLVGQPVETAMAISSLVLSGLLERRPGLRIVLAHGGGYVPFAPARMDHGWAVRPELTTAERPSDALKRLYYDSLTFAPELLETLARRVGADRIVLGSDFPFDMGCEDPVGHVHAAAGLSGAQREAILGANAAALLGLDGV